MVFLKATLFQSSLPSSKTKYLNAILMYAMIIVMNRHRAVHGLEPVTDLFSDKTDESLKAAFDGLYATEGSRPVRRRQGQIPILRYQLLRTRKNP